MWVAPLLLHAEAVESAEDRLFVLELPALAVPLGLAFAVGQGEHFDGHAPPVGLVHGPIDLFILGFFALFFVFSERKKNFFRFFNRFFFRAESIPPQQMALHLTTRKVVRS